MPKLHIISGCNGSGKTTASYNYLPELLGCWQFVNSDEFAKTFSPFDPKAVSVTASRYMLMKINYLLGRYESFSIETTLATRSLVNIIEEAHALGYEVSLIYFWLNSPELAIARVRDRVASGGHDISEETIVRRYYMGLKYFFETYRHLVDNWILADNSKSRFDIIATGDRHETNIKDNNKLNYIWKSIYPNEQY